MTSYRRLRQPGATYFFTLCLENRGSAVLTDRIDLLRSAYGKTMREMPLARQAVVVLPDHLHAIWTLPEGDMEFSERWRRVKSRFSHAVPESFSRNPSKATKRERGLWQRRFWEHLIRDEQDFAAHFDYCRVNPVKHGLVTDPSDWPYSSFARKFK